MKKAWNEKVRKVFEKRGKNMQEVLQKRQDRGKWKHMLKIIPKNHSTPPTALHLQR